MSSHCDVLLLSYLITLIVSLRLLDFRVIQIYSDQNANVLLLGTPHCVPTMVDQWCWLVLSVIENICCVQKQRNKKRNVLFCLTYLQLFGINKLLINKRLILRSWEIGEYGQSQEFSFLWCYYALQLSLPGKCISNC